MPKVRNQIKRNLLLHLVVDLADSAAASEDIPSTPYLTLRRLAVWLGEPRLRLRLLASVAGALTNLKVGQPTK